MDNLPLNEDKSLFYAIDDSNNIPELDFQSLIFESNNSVDKFVEDYFNYCIFQKLANDSKKFIAYGKLSYFIFMVCLVGPLCLFGIIGNIISLVVLYRSNKKCPLSITVLLQALSFGNLIYLLYGLLIPTLFELNCFISIPLLKTYSKLLLNWFIHLITMSDISHMFVVYVVLMIAVERQIVAQTPFKCRGQLFTLRWARAYLFCIIFASIIFHLPKFFEISHINMNFSQVKLVSENISDTMFNKNETALTIQVPTEWKHSHLLNSSHLTILYNIAAIGIQQVFPIAIIIISNFRLVFTLRKAKNVFSGFEASPLRSQSINGNIEERATPCRMVRHGQNSSDSLNKGTYLAICTVTIFVLAETPMLLYNLLLLHHSITNNGPLEALLLLDHLARAFLLLQACSNLIVYFLLSSNFRRNLKSFCSNRSNQSNVLIDFYRMNYNHAMYIRNLHFPLEERSNGTSKIGSAARKSSANLSPNLSF